MSTNIKATCFPFKLNMLSMLNHVFSKIYKLIMIVSDLCVIWVIWNFHQLYMVEAWYSIFNPACIVYRSYIKVYNKIMWMFQIYVSYEMSTQTMFDNPRDSPNVEYVEDIVRLSSFIIPIFAFAVNFFVLADDCY